MARGRKRKRRATAKAAKGKNKTFVFHKGFKPDRRSWMAKPVALAIASLMMKAIQRVGTKTLGNEVALEVEANIWHCGCTEYEQLKDTEKTDLGTVIEATILRVLGLMKCEDGKDTIIFVEIDGLYVPVRIDIKSSCCKKNKTNESGPMPSGWQISLECWDDICILASFCPYTARFSLGILDCSVKGYLNPLPKGRNKGGPGRDKKKTVSKEGKKKILWLIHECQTIEGVMRKNPGKYQERYAKATDEIKSMILADQRDRASKARTSMEVHGAARRRAVQPQTNCTLRKLV